MHVHDRQAFLVIISPFLVISSKVDEKDEKDLRMSPHIVHHGEDGEEHELDSAGDAGGDRCPADEIAEMENVVIPRGIEGAGLQGDAGRRQEGVDPVDDDGGALAGSRARARSRWRRRDFSTARRGAGPHRL